MTTTSLKCSERMMARAVPQDPDPRTTAFVVDDGILLTFLWFVFRDEFVLFSRNEIFDVRAVFPDRHECDENGEDE